MVAAQAITVQALSFGPEALAAREGPCQVLGVTGKAIYLQTFEGRVLALVGPQAHDSPITIRISNFSRLARVVEDNHPGKIQLERGEIIFPGSTASRISLPPLRLWSPNIPRITAPDLDFSLTRVVAGMIAERASQEGAAPIALSFSGPGRYPPLPLPLPESQPIARRIARHLEEAVGSLHRHSVAHACKHLIALLGLGPGLTPSGDDFLAGLLAALRWQSTGAPFVSQLAEEVQIEAPKRTNRISAALLRYASGGVLYAPAMDLGHALGQGSSVRTTVATQGLLAVGATSGADTATGILAGLHFARLLVAP